MIGIYKITSPSRKIYIGQSVDIQSRFKSYKKLQNCSNQIRLYRSFLKHGVDNHIFEIIEESTVEFLNERERFWQEHYDVIGGNGLNCFLTATNEKIKIASENTKIKQSEVKRGERNYFFGKSHTEETKKKISKAHKGKKFSKESKEKMSIAKSKCVLDTETGVVYTSLKQASQAIGINYKTLIGYMNRKSNKTPLKYC